MEQRALREVDKKIELENGYKKIEKLLTSYQEFQVLATAVETKIFEKMVSPKSIKDLCFIFQGSDQHKLESFLEILVDIGYVDKIENMYVNSFISSILLCHTSPYFVGGLIKHNKKNLYPLWGHLTSSLINNKPQLKDSHDIDYLPLLEGLAAYSIESEFKRNFNMIVKPGMKVLDVGGGLGAYSLFFENMGCEVTYIDKHDIAPFADNCLSDTKVKIIEGNFLTHSFREKYDIVFASEVIHGKSEQNVHILIEKGAGLLKNEGYLIIKDLFEQDTDWKLFDLNMLLCTKAGRTYSKGEIEKIIRTVNQISGPMAIEGNVKFLRGEAIIAQRTK